VHVHVHDLRFRPSVLEVAWPTIRRRDGPTSLPTDQPADRPAPADRKLADAPFKRRAATPPASGGATDEASLGEHEHEHEHEHVYVYVYVYGRLAALSGGDGGGERRGRVRPRPGRAAPRSGFRRSWRCSSRPPRRAGTGRSTRPSGRTRTSSGSHPSSRRCNPTSRTRPGRSPCRCRSCRTADTCSQRRAHRRAGPRSTCRLRIAGPGDTCSSRNRCSCPSAA